MYLESLEIHGFKSFGKKTRFVFTDGISSIVGPNGCGKSNIVDAIRWVLGEQKSGLLRSDRMENVIFNGSKSMKPLGMAEVSLTIQNTKNVLPVEYSEVVITRRLFRSSESQYLINNSLCRLKDIQDLFMDTGMGPDAYSIIELSMVESILNGKAEERRRIFEEAASVTKYKRRRQAAYRKLE
ncbi:MAG: AAA family ATPase, partial [bacterium]